MVKILKSEFYKLKHTYLPHIHIILPIIYAIIFYIMVRITGLKDYASISIIETYLVLLGAILPIVCGAITFKVIDMEANAGHFQVLLSTTKSRSKAYGGKLLLLLIGALFSISLAILMFSFLFRQQSYIAWVIEGFLLFVGCIATYVIHLWISLMIGGSASIGLGFAETLLALISMTGLGEKIWYFLPCTWPSRLSATYSVGSSLADSTYLHDTLSMWLYIAVPMTICILICSFIWFNKWDGKPYSSD
ncbi:lantibiotic immunity ABC transporter MutG family permease subunit [Allofustis seminis]|uniref:lantibiotic immunity ABC transporter MutG family permease subunit n=1 Tax=Allofustis seminis TaxID=166939 RepID=UPI00037A31B7|nr:lantibiotic immunity ABC transporter MutG family permease subunit [Allofustis seminis]